MILGFFINRQTGILFFHKDLNQFLIRHVCRSKNHINTGNHNILGNGIPKIENVVNEILFFFFNDAVFLTDFHDRPKFHFRHGLFALPSDSKKAAEEIADGIHQNNDRCEDEGQYGNRSGIKKSHRFPFFRCNRFWCDFTKNQNEKGQDTRSEPNEGAGVFSESRL